MNEESDAQLLRAYAVRRDETAFRTLVERYTDFVYSAALRQVESSAAAADLTQGVFTDLARKSPEVLGKNRGNSLAGWLHRATRYAVINHLRDTRRRHEYERQAMEQLLTNSDSAAEWEQIRPRLDEALDSLADEDREALLMRYFKNQDLRAVGLALGVSDDAAQKRVSRAVERLREFFAKRRVTIGASGLVVAISANAVHAAPVGLAVTISTAAATLTGTTLATTATATATKAIAMTAIQKTLVTATVAVLAGAGIYEARQTSQLREKVNTLEKQQAPLAEQVQQLARERDAAITKLAAVQEQNEVLRRNAADLPRLRGDVARLRNESRELAQLKQDDPALLEMKSWRDRVDQLRQYLQRAPEHQIPQLGLLTEDAWLDVAKHARLDTELGFRRAMGQLRSTARGRVAGMMSVALVKYVKANAGQLPGDIRQLNPYFQTPLDDAILQQYQLLQTGKLSDLPEGQWIITERSPLEDGFDTTFRVGYDRFGVERSGPLEDALGRFYEANPGQQPTSLSQLRAYVNDSAD